jgi:hypothetical protein
MSERSDVAAEVAARLRRRGVLLDDRETDEELVTLLEAVEGFEREVERLGGDLMVDEPVAGHTPQPDDVAFVLPRREPQEKADAYAARIIDAAAALAQREE